MSSLPHFLASSTRPRQGSFFGIITARRCFSMTAYDRQHQHFPTTTETQLSNDCLADNCKISSNLRIHTRRQSDTSLLACNKSPKQQVFFLSPESSKTEAKMQWTQQSDSKMIRLLYHQLDARATCGLPTPQPAMRIRKKLRPIDWT